MNHVQNARRQLKEDFPRLHLGGEGSTHTDTRPGHKSRQRYTQTIACTHTYTLTHTHLDKTQSNYYRSQVFGKRVPKSWPRHPRLKVGFENRQKSIEG